MEWIVYFLVGIVVNLLATLYTRSVANKKILPAAVSSFLIDLLSFSIFFSILEKMNHGGNDALIKILIYSLGAALGTALVMLDLKKLFNKAFRAVMYFLF